MLGESDLSGLCLCVVNIATRLFIICWEKRRHVSDEEKRDQSFWVSAIRHASKFDKDTFVICLIVISAFLALIAGVPLASAIGAAVCLMAAYAIFRAWMLQTQIKERIFLIKSTTPEEAKKLSEAVSTEAENKLMLEYSKALEYQRAKENDNGR